MASLQNLTKVRVPSRRLSNMTAQWQNECPPILKLPLTPRLFSLPPANQADARQPELRDKRLAMFLLFNFQSCAL
jgi:hypothetical protein